MSRRVRVGDRDGAYDAARAILERTPGQREALGALFNLLREDGNVEAAAIIVQRLTLLHPNDSIGLIAAVQFFLARRDLARAQYHSRRLVLLGPEAPISHFLMGQVFLAQGNAPAAEHHFRKALLLGEDASQMLREVDAYLASALRRMGRFDEARSIFERLEQGDDVSVEVLLNWAGLEEADRNFERANELLDRARTIAPNDARIAAMKTTVLRRLKQPQQSLKESEAPEEEGALSSALLERGHTLDSMGRYDEAFAAYDAFKRQLRERTGTAYGETEAAAQVGRLRGFFTEGRSRLLPRARSPGEGSPQPIFIVGFPRSGTTLVEQTLSTHPAIAAGDELPVIDSIAGRTQQLLHSPLSYPRSLSELWFGDRAAHVDMLRDHYLADAALHGAITPGKRWFTDKMPLNEMHLGLIHLLFPQSPVIHLVRHPLDVVLSVFANWLTHGFYCAYTLESAARHYALVADLIAHYRAVLPLRYHAVRYEELVADQEGQIRALLEFIGAPFDPRTLAFHENARPARTASYAQVTEKLYTRSVFRYRNYLKHLEPVLPILMPTIERLGYSVDGCET
ncbi:MAG: tetratricopeptide repeat-containing sulfotransferase family protein [Tsuneonella suprasediminis]